MLRVWVVVGLVSLLGCGSKEQPAGDSEAISAALSAAVKADPRLGVPQPLAPEDYAALAARMASVPGVEAAEYAGDTLGTVEVQVRGEGVLVYRHIRDGWGELASLPPEADFSGQFHSKYNAGWTSPVVEGRASHVRSRELAQANTYATRFPAATMNPDPDFTQDEVPCPQESKIAIVDFQNRDFGPDEKDVMSSDGVMLYDRLRFMADAAGFILDFFPDSRINTTNFDELADYTVVIVVAHGSMPNRETAERLGVAVPSIFTPELYDPAKRIVGGLTQFEAWKKGYILRDQDEDRHETKVKLTPRLFRDLYKPRVPQLWMVNSCWGMLTKDDQGFGRTGKLWTWGKKPSSVLYNFGDGLMDAADKAGQPMIVFGYVTPRPTPSWSTR